MAISTKMVTTTWQAITSAGESGSVWPTWYKRSRRRAADVVIFHTDGSAPTGKENIKQAKRLFPSKSNTDMMIISADNSSDIFYARCLSNGAVCEINVDVV